MNCQEISRLVDARKFGTLTEMERRDGDAHALACRHCAPLWLAHARLSAISIPPMPPELATRCLTLAAAHAQPAASARASQRMKFVVGGFVVLAAAAVMLFVNLADAPAARAPAPVVAQAATTGLPGTPVTAPEESAASAAPVASPVVTPPLGPLPLLPAPVNDDQERRRQMDMVLQKATVLYPELVEGPEIEGSFVVAIAMRTDGTILSSAIRVATPSDRGQVVEELNRSVPNDGGSQTFTGFAKGRKLPDGGTLRGAVTLGFTVVPNEYDPSRSNLRVQEIVRPGHAYLLLPTGGEGMNYLTVFLSEDGTIQREDVQFLRPRDVKPAAPQVGTDPKDQFADYAKGIADTLGLRTDQLGTMGFATVEDRSTPVPRSFIVKYAWPRRAGESAPVFGQGINASGSRPRGGFDTAAALVIVERLIPEAFTEKAHPQGVPAVVLTAEGEVIRVDRVKLLSSEDEQLQLRNLAAGRVSILTRGRELVNEAGQKATVLFIWQYTAAQAAALPKASTAAPER